MSESQATRRTAQVTARGIRNNVLVLPSVICSHMVADRIADAVDGCVATPHDHGCAQIGRDNDRTKRTLIAMGAHPNVVGTVVVGLGCEHVQSDTVAAELERRGVPVRELTIQGVGGTDECIEQGVDAAESLRATAAAGSSTIEIGDLRVGVVSTDLDEPTRDVADPLVGELTDRVLDAGGRVLVAGTERVAAHPDEAGDRIDADIDWLLADARSGPPRAPRVHRQVDGCSFAEATRAWGNATVDELVEYGDVPRSDAGLALVDSSSRFEEAATALVAAGAHLVVHITSDGIPTGHPIAPVVKISATPSTIDAVGADIDVDARTTDVNDLVEDVRSIANGRPCRAERHGVTSFAIERVGPSM